MISPSLEVTLIQLALVDGVSTGDGAGLLGVPGPVGAAQRQVGESTVTVASGVPNGVQVAGTADVGEVLVVATGVTVGVGVTDLSGRVEGLMDITDVVDNESESE